MSGLYITGGIIPTV